MNSLNLQMPESIELDESTYSNTYGKFIVQPLERGFGNNLVEHLLCSYLCGAFSMAHILQEDHPNDFLEGRHRPL